MRCLLTGGITCGGRWLVQLLSEAARSTPSVVYLPRLDSLWSYLAERLLELLRELPRRAPLLLLATCDTDTAGRLPSQVRPLTPAPSPVRPLTPTAS